MEPKEITQTLGHQPKRNVKPSTSYKNTIDPQERLLFLKEMEKAREDMAEFKKNMAMLVEQMNTISTDLENSKDRVSEVEHDLTITQEVNVNLQVLLEKAVKTQRESDTTATQTIRNMYSKLTLVVYENKQLQGRLTLLEKHQKTQQGNVHHAAKRIDEYTQMLEQAQGTIHLLQEPKSPLSSRRTSTTSSSWTDDEKLSQATL
ncbi:unnamed protein product [Rhizopus stolonifer]